MSDVLEYQPPPATLIAPKRWRFVVAWTLLVLLNGGIFAGMVTSGRAPFASLICAATVAVYPTLMLLRELGVFSPRRIPDLRRYAFEIEAQLRRTLGSPLECQAADLNALLPPQRVTMVSLSVEFEGARFKHLGDYVDHAARRLARGAAPDSHHLSRVFAMSDDPRWSATATLAGDSLGSLLTIDFRTEFADGSFLTTTESRIRATAPRPEDDVVELVPSDWGVEKMMRRHTARLDELATQSRTPAPVHTLEDVCAQSERDRQRRLAWCQKNGFVTPDHVRAVMEAEGWLPELQEVAVNAMPK